MQTVTQNLNAETVEGRVVYVPAGSRLVPVDLAELPDFQEIPGAGYFFTLADWIRAASPEVDALVVPLAYVAGEVAP